MWWWMVGHAGAVPHFYFAPTSGHAIAEYRSDLIREKIDKGSGFERARKAVAKLDIKLIEGPLDSEWAFELHLEWVWAVTATLSRNEDDPSQPLKRVDAMRVLGKDKTFAVEKLVAKRYFMSSGQPKKTSNEKPSERKFVGIPNLEQLAERWLKGETLKNLAKETEFSHTHLRSQFKKAGYSIKGLDRGRPIPNLEELARRYREDGESIVDLAKETDFTPNTLRERFRKNKLV